MLCVRSAITCRAAPKSSSTGQPSGCMRMLSGEMSRWNTDAACSVPSAPSSVSRMRRSSGSVGAPAEPSRKAFSVTPS